jgi:pimeloyl-ACP methyl ester carboxylesterase
MSTYRAKTSRRIRRHQIRGVDYACSEWGDPTQPLIVYLHGWGDCSATFQAVVDELSRDWFVVAPDWRGFGESTVDAECFWFPDYLADLHEVLEIYSPARPVLLLGHSMGGNIGSLYAGTMPERIAAFINIEGFGLNETDPDNAPAHLRRWLERGREAVRFAEYDKIEDLERRIRQHSPRAGDPWIRFVAEAWTQTRKKRLRLRANPRHKLPNAIPYRRRESEACWRQVTAPVLLVAGRNSPFARLGDEPAGCGISDLPYPGASVEIVEHVGHMIHFEAPAELAALIEVFFAKYL